jgi:CO/xanthine dehydrogenase Mo-binding subunit
MRQDDVAERVFGRVRYLDDVDMEDLLHGRFVRSEVAHARLGRIDMARAAAHPGVVRVLTAVDLARDGRVPRFGPLVADQPVLADRVVRYRGEPVALIVARTKRDAMEAAALVAVETEPLTPALSVADALGLPPIHAAKDRPDAQRAWAGTNVMGAWEYAWGDLGEAEAITAIVLEARYSAPFAHHLAIETHGAIAIPEPDGISVLSSAQHPFILRRALAEMLGWAEDAVRVRSMPMGGSFGAKGYPKLEPAVVLAALALGEPVKVVLDAEETFLTAQREASQVHARTGFDAHGRITFQDMEADFLVGAWSDISPRVVAKTGLHALAPYRAPAARVRARGLFSTTPPTTAFRGFGAPHTILALEGQMDRAASSLGIDPLELRLRNIRARGEPSAYRETPVDGDWARLLRMAAEGLGWGSPKRASVGNRTLVGRGIAIGVKSCIPGTSSSARVRLDADGAAVLEVGTSEMGNGTAALLADLVERRLGRRVRRVSVVAADTALTPPDALTASSRSTVHMGNAVEAACDDLLARLPAARSAGAKEILGQGSYTADGDPSHPLGGPTPFYEAVATAVELTVDERTGHLDIEHIVHVTDAGRVLDPVRARGLDEGGLVMGIGLATSEQLILDSDGRARNGSTLDYRIPTTRDAPPRMTSLFLENGDGPGPDGAKGLAEGGVLAVAPAICAAVADATGLFLGDLPLTPERVWRALTTSRAAGVSGSGETAR